MKGSATRMQTSLYVFAALLAMAFALVAAHFALIEVGREVITLRTQGVDGRWTATRLWIVDDDGTAWLHSGGKGWAERFVGDPIVELQRAGTVQRYRAHPVPGLHPRIHQRLREKYGFADRWVRFIGPDREDTLVVRLDPIEPVI